MNIQERYEGILSYFAVHDPAPRTELFYGNPFELLVAVVLSAQCTDARINEVTPGLFECYPTPEAMRVASVEDIKALIRSVSYPNNKARHLHSLSAMLVEKYGGEVPREVGDLQSLPGVGRKTAHVVAATLYDAPTLGVDTHVFRLARRIGLVSRKARTPEAVEREMMPHLSDDYVSRINHWLVLHGRYICKARKPLCEQCPITKYCTLFQTGIDHSK